MAEQSDMKGRFWQAQRYDEFIWVAFVYHIEGDRAHYLEYMPGELVPQTNNAPVENFQEHWKEISAATAQSLIGNMSLQDEEYAYRLGKKNEAEKLASALKILEGKVVGSVRFGENCVCVTTDNGAEYEIAFSKTEGFRSRRTALPDPW